MLLLGRHWSWITPERLFYEMTLEDVQACLDHVARFELRAKTKEQYKAMTTGLMEWIAPGGKQDLSFIKGRIGKVLKANG